MNRSLRACCAALLGSLCVACPRPDAGGAPQGRAPESEEEKVVYAMGALLSRNLREFELTPEELPFLFRGIREGIEGSESPVPLAEYAPKIQARAASLRADRLTEEKDASAAFLALESGAEGAETFPSGLVMRVLEPGDGPSPTAADTVEVHYHGTLRDGSVFDSSVERGEPARFPLGRVVPCWTEALQKMSVGEKARITCPAEIGYGDRGAPPSIPPGAVLIFEIELLEIVAAS